MMNEDFYIENQETWYDHLYFEPPYDPDDYLYGAGDEDFDYLYGDDFPTEDV